jgi:choline dehydrogenase
MFYLAYLLIFSIIQFHSTILVSSNSCNGEKEKSSYDYIVIGSGPGGATVATRLALNNFKVLLIEAGPDYDDIVTQTPALWPFSHVNPKITAHFNTYLYSKAENVQIDYPRGITLGGSTQINAMLMMTANPSEWDNIAQLTNDNDWNYQNIKTKYQTLVENCEFCTDNNAKNGWLNISTSTSASYSSPLFGPNPVINDLFKAVDSQVQYNPNAIENNTYDSYFYTPKSVSQNSGIRSGAFRRIKNVQSIKSSNFHVWTNTFVTKLIIDPQTKEACGVEYSKGAYLYKASSLASFLSNSLFTWKYRIYAKREIIVAGSQFMSPQLLQLSGIGDQNLLKQYGIKVIQHLPGVGLNQQDRNEIPFIVKLKQNPNLPGSINFNCILNGILNNDCLINSLNDSTTDFLTSNNVPLCLLRSAQPIVPNFPDSVLFFIPFRFTGFRKNWVLKLLPYLLGSYLTVDINFARTELDNLGSVRIQSINAFDTPLIEFNHFKGENKQIIIKQIIEHIRFLRKLFFETEFSKYVDSEDLPGSHLTTDEQLTEYLYQYVWGHHACCTNKMGNTETDPLAVVNSKGQVKGIQKLRIADISIFPKIPGYFPVVSIAVAAEKIADDIIQQANQ